MRELSRGAADSAAALEDRPAPVDLRGAIPQQVEGGSRRRSECKRKMDVQALHEEAATAMRCEWEESADTSQMYL
jgi:hypothetical protein